MWNPGIYVCVVSALYMISEAATQQNITQGSRPWEKYGAHNQLSDTVTILADAS